MHVRPPVELPTLLCPVTSNRLALCACTEQPMLPLCKMLEVLLLIDAVLVCLFQGDQGEGN